MFDVLHLIVHSKGKWIFRMPKMYYLEQYGVYKFGTEEFTRELYWPLSGLTDIFFFYLQNILLICYMA